MELEELKALWQQQDEKLNKSLQLNMKLLRELNFDKASNKLRTLFFLKLVEIAILIFMVIYLSGVFIMYLTQPGFSIPSFIIMAFIVSGCISDVRQLSIIIQLRKDKGAPVSQLQKRVERLKLLIINYTKMSFISIPFYPLLMIIAAKLFFNVNIWLTQYRGYLIANCVVGLLLLPLFLSLFRQLGKQNIKQIWVSNFLSGSGWNQAVLAQKFLNEIEEFEREG
jgi:hypothetical protein